uniref:protein-tyrosine-phosphatase n=1 Tax=Araucaria cunninghamii TaxID=56994 RepID=A0A0D6R8Z1_ARACU
MRAKKDMDKICDGICQVMEGKLYFCVVQRGENKDARASRLPRPAICFSVDDELVYEPFYADFGPLNLACTYHFCIKLQQLLKEVEADGHCVCFCCSSDPKKKANAAVLLGAYLVIVEHWEPEVAYAPLSQFASYLPFRDPTCAASTYHLTVRDCVRALAKAKQTGWIDFSSFNVDEYEYFEKVENGDLNWMVPNKLVAFCGPGARRIEKCGYQTLVPEDYVDYFKQTSVNTVIRLNRRMYNKHNFTDHGISLHDLYFPDGSCPPERIVQRFLEILEGSSGAVAVHCKAGLGRTGVLIGCYIMKHYRFTANEVLGYLRIVRPGSVIGRQQHFLQNMQSRMWKAGEMMKHQKLTNIKNMRQNVPPAGNDFIVATSDVALVSAMAGLSTGTGTCQHGKGKFQGTKLYLANPVVRKTSALGLNESSSAKCSMPKGMGRNNSDLKAKQKRFLVNEEGLNDVRSSGANASPLSAQSTRTSSTSLSVPCAPGNAAARRKHFFSTSTCKKLLPFKENPCPYNLQPHSTLCLNSDKPRILSKANVDHRIPSRNVCTQ